MRKENKENGESSRHAKYKQCESSQSHPAQLPGPVQAEETENVNKKRRWNQINKDKVINGKHSSTQGSSKNPKRHRTIGIFEKKKKKTWHQWLVCSTCNKGKMERSERISSRNSGTARKIVNQVNIIRVVRVVK